MKIDNQTKNQIKPWVIFAAICAFFAYLVLHFDQILGIFNKFFGLSISFFYAIVLAFVLNIPMMFFENNLKKAIDPENWFYTKIRSISIFLTMIFAFFIISIFLSILIPQLIDSAILLTNNIFVYTENIIKTINEFLVTVNLDEMGITLDPNILNQYISSITANWQTILQTATNWAGNAGQMIVKNAMAITGEVMNWFMAIMLSLYLLSSKESLIMQLKKIVAAILPLKVTKKVFEIANRANYTFSHFISGQLVEAVIIGSLIYVGMLIFGLGENFEILIGTVTAVLSLIPMFGAMAAMMFGFILILATNPIEAVLFIVFYQTVQQLENNLIYPRVVGKSVGLPGIWVLLSIVIFGGFFGLFGTLIAVPTTALLYSLFREFINWRLDTRKLSVTPEGIVEKDELDEK